MNYPNAPDESMVRCPNCSAPNPDGAAYCEACATPLTAYGGGSGTGPSAATLEKLRRASVRPPIVGVVSAVLVLAAVLGPFQMAAGSFLTQRAASTSGQEMYIFHAIGGAVAFVVALIMVPLGVFMLITAWAAWRQQGWAWTAVMVMLGLSGMHALGAIFGASLFGLIRLGVTAALAYAWLQPAAKEWYGKND